MDLELTDDRSRHSLSVARKMYSLAMERFPGEEGFAQEMFVLGTLHARRIIQTII